MKAISFIFLLLVFLCVLVSNLSNFTNGRFTPQFVLYASLPQLMADFGHQIRNLGHKMKVAKFILLHNDADWFPIKNVLMKDVDKCDKLRRDFAIVLKFCNNVADCQRQQLQRIFDARESIVKCKDAALCSNERNLVRFYYICLIFNALFFLTVFNSYCYHIFCVGRIPKDWCHYLCQKNTCVCQMYSAKNWMKSRRILS